MLAGLLVLAGCSTTPSAPGGAARGTRSLPAGADGPPPAGSDAPDVSQVPDAEPRLEPIRAGGPNKPYEVLGQTYTPMTTDEPLVERGLASWYGRKFHGKRTASGEAYNMYAMTAAHKTMPIPSYARVRNPANGREVIVRVNDRGPFSSGRVIDLSYAAAVKLGVQNGVAPVEVERITYEDIRAGLAGRAPVLAQAPASPPGAPAGSTAGPVSAPVTAPAPVPAPATEPVAVAAAPAPAPAGPTAEPPPEQARAHTAAASGYWLQLGAFGKGSGAYSFQQKVAADLDWLAPLLAVFAEGGMHRLQAGPYATREQAREAGERVRSALALVPVIVERR
ncbi:MAG: septal ring lytic transglycosylase RlpA family protein [Burkholderiaceae bacterium]